MNIKKTGGNENQIKPVETEQNRLFSNRDLLLLIWPLIVEQLLNVTVGMADTLMVATLGEAAISGVSLVDSINVLLFGIFAALATGGAVVASQYIGRNDLKQASRTAVQLIYTMLALSAFITFVFVVFASPILRVIFGEVEADVMAQSKKYFTLTMISLPAMAMYNAVAALFRAQGNSKASMIASVITNVINIGGNAICIFGLHMGVEGVAIPTVISRFAACVLLLYWMLQEKPYEGKEAISIKNTFKDKFDFELTKKVLKIGVPNGLENSVFQIGKILVLSLIATFGTSAIAANAAANVIASIEVLPASSINFAVLTVVGQCVGFGNEKQTVYYTKKMMAIAFASMFVWNVPLLLFCYKILGFYHMSSDATNLAWLMAMIHGTMGILIWPWSFTMPNALRATGDAAFTMWVSLISMWLLRVGLSYAFKYTQMFGLLPALELAPVYGAVGVWVAMIIDWILRSTLFVTRFAGGKWKTKKVI